MTPTHTELAEKLRDEELAAMLMIVSGMTIDKQEALRRINKTRERQQNCQHQWRYRIGDTEYCADCNKRSSTTAQGGKKE